MSFTRLLRNAEQYQRTRDAFGRAPGPETSESFGKAERDLEYAFRAVVDPMHRVTPQTNRAPFLPRITLALSVLVVVLEPFPFVWYMLRSEYWSAALTMLFLASAAWNIAGALDAKGAPR